MNLNFIRNIVFFIILVVIQALVLNHIRLFGCATPLLYAYFVLPMQRGQGKWATLLWCFAMGLAIDIFSNTAISGNYNTDCCMIGHDFLRADMRCL